MSPGRTANSQIQFLGSGGSDARPSLQPTVVSVGTSPVNLVVITRFAERIGLRAIALSPEQAVQSLPVLKPAIIVVDGGADNRQCDELLDVVDALRQASRNGNPRLLFLTMSAQTQTQSCLHPIADAVLAKPITQDRLQPALVDLAKAAG